MFLSIFEYYFLGNGKVCTPPPPPVKEGMHRRRIKTKTKAVASIWWEEFNQFLATLAVLHWTIWIIGWIAPGYFERRGWFILFFKIVLGIMIIWRKKIWRKSIIVGWWYVWCEPDDHPFFSKHLFRQAAVILFILFSKSSLGKRDSPARNWINWLNSAHNTAVMIFAFSSVCILLLWRDGPIPHPTVKVLLLLESQLIFPTPW